MNLARDVSRQARALVAARLGLDFPEDRRADFEYGFIAALRQSGCDTAESYLARLAAIPDDGPELNRLASRLTIGETYFFRDRAVFDALETDVLPALIAERRASGSLRLRFWSAACATGEEPYSLAMLLDRLLPDLADWSITILATDIDTQALEAAQRGLYRPWSFRDMPPQLRLRYFRRTSNDLDELDPGLRRAVTFAPLNLAAERYPDIVTNTIAMDLVFCRNVLMYFTPEAQRAVVARLRRALVVGGWLVVSPAEASFDLLQPLVPVSYAGAIFYCKQPPARPVSIPPASAPSITRDPVPPSRALPAPPESNALEQARLLADQGHLDRARRLCERAIAKERLDPEAHLLLAAICQETGDIRAAFEALRAALYLDPASAPAHFLLGSLLLREGEARRGMQSIETVTKLLGSMPADAVVAGSGGLTAGRLLATARAYLNAAEPVAR